MAQKMKKCTAWLLSIVILLGLVPLQTISATYANGYDGGRAGDGNGIYARGIDISEWQGDSVDFEKVKEQGYSFVILRAGFATTRDDTFEDNYSRAKAAGLDVGVYLYSYAENKEEAGKEAEALLGWLSGKRLEYPVYYDLEDPKAHGSMSVEALTEIAMTFLDKVSLDGWLVGLYSCRSWLDAKLDTEKICARYECWLAQYLSDGTSDTYDDYNDICGMWQFSCSGKVEGIPGEVDMNVCFKDYPTICQKYGFNGYSATGATIILTGATVSPVLLFGEHMPITGKITSSSGNLSDISVGFYSETGERVKGRSAGPKATTYDLSSMNDGIKSQELPEGRYEYRISATNTFESLILYSETVVVSKNGVRLDDVAFPEDLKEGDKFPVKGTLLSVVDFVSVTVTVKEQNKAVLQAAAEGSGTSFDLVTLGDELKFENLDAGEYTFCIDAVTARGSFSLASKAFHVWVKNDPITVTDLSLKKDYYPGDEIVLTGSVVSANSDMESFDLEILDRDGEVIASVQKASSGRKLALEDFKEDIRLENLKIGSYTCLIHGQNAGGPQKVLEQKFYIRPDAISLCDSRLPATLVKGENFSLKGVVASDATPLKFVSLTVTDINGKAHLSAADIPVSNIYDLSQLNDQLLFSRLMVNDYTLRLTARNGHQDVTLYEGALEVTTNPDSIRWADGCFDPTGVACSPNSAMSIWGELVSDRSPISVVSAGIFTAEENRLMASARIYPEQKTVQVDAFNQVLRFSALSPGEYRLVITATNTGGTYEMVNAPFEVSQCPHSDVSSGIIYEADCTSDGAVCDSRCLDCGARIYGGLRSSRTAHTYRDGRCTVCGRPEFVQVSVQKTDIIPNRNGRIVIAVNDGGVWHALGSDGKAVQIPAPDAAGKIQCSAELLWTPEEQKDGSYILRNPYGRLLHFDRNGLFVGRGVQNAGLVFTLDSQQMELSSAKEDSCCLSWEDGSFVLSQEHSRVVIFAYLSP